MTKTQISQHKSIRPSLTAEKTDKTEKPRVQQPGSDKKPTQPKTVIYGSTDNRVKKPQTMEEIIDTGASMRLTILSPDEDPARKQYEEQMKRLDAEKARMEELERRRQITLREQKELEDAKELAAAQAESRRIDEEEEENRQKGEKSKMTLRPRTKSSSTCKSSGEDSEEDSDNESYPPDSEDGTQENADYRAQFSNPGREIVDPSSNDEEMDTT